MEIMEPFVALWAEVVEANPLKNMVGPWGLEPQTSTVSTYHAYKKRRTYTVSNRLCTRFMPVSQVDR